jgi:hypothetical protein
MKYKYTDLIVFVLNLFYSQLYMNGIEQQAMSIQALSFLHVHDINSVKWYITIISMIYDNYVPSIHIIMSTITC